MPAQPYRDTASRNPRREIEGEPLRGSASPRATRPVSAPSASDPRMQAGSQVPSPRTARRDTVRPDRRTSPSSSASTGQRPGQPARSRRAQQSARAAANTDRGSIRRGEDPRSNGQERYSARGSRRGRDAAPAKSKSRYIPALDGLRALAVLAVIVYHMGVPWASGGLLGVTVFFVLSGYLITSLLLIELDDTGRINLPQFWLRRIRRLFPAIVFVVFGTAALCTVFDHSLLTKLREDMWAALCWVTNWWYIFHDVSYFDALGAPSPLTHFWSLAIEEQFYLFWPLVLFIAHKLGVKRSIMANATLVVALASAVEMAVLYDPLADPSRVYYGTDTRAFSLLIGAWLAYVWPSHLLGAKKSVQLPVPVRRALDGVGLAALAALVAMIALADGFSPFLYRGGLLLASVLTAVVIAVMVHPASLVGRIAGAAPLVWVGKRSYGIYLWHYPLLLIMNPGNSVAQAPWWMLLLQMAVIFAVAAFSYRFIEEPFRHGALGKVIAEVRSGTFDVHDWLYFNGIIGGACSVVALVAVVGLAVVPNTSALEGADLLKDASPKTAGVPLITGDEEEAPVLDVLMIGDSVSVRAIPAFQEAFPFGAIDAAVNRQLFVGEDVYDYYAHQNIVGDVVVFALGTNGLVTDDQLDELIEMVGTDKHIFFVNTRSTQSWMGETNEALRRAAERYDNVSVIDWYSYSADKGDLFDGDGTHLTEDGARAYIALVRDAIAEYLPQHNEDDEAAEVLTPWEFAQKGASKTLDKFLRNTQNAVARSIDAPLSPFTDEERKAREEAEAAKADAGDESNNADSDADQDAEGADSSDAEGEAAA